MDNTVLAEQRRETVINLLKGMKIKKTDGDGFDKDDVYVCMQQLCDVYEKSIEDLTTSYDEQIADMQDKYQKYDENNDLYISLIMEAKKSSNEIITKAKAEVDEILTNGKEQIAKQEEEIEFARKAAEQEKANLKAGTDRAREEAEATKAAIAAEVEEDRKQAETIRQNYKNRIEAMEQEFEEIKTNILRTAGKIDGLKAQINEGEIEHEWKISETIGRVDVPEPDISVEDTTQVDVPAAAAAATYTEPAVEAPVIEEPVMDAPVIEEPVVKATAVEQPGSADDDLTFEDLVAKLQSEAPGEEEAPVEVEVPEAVEVNLPDNMEDVGLEGLEEVAAEAPAEGEISLDGLVEENVEPEETPIDEISFEGLEELFKE